MKEKSGAQPLLKIIREKLLPQLAGNDLERVILARHQQADLQLPPTVQVSPAGKLGKRVTTRRGQLYGHHIIAAQWPRDGQEALHVPMLWCIAAGHLDLRIGEYILHLDEGHQVFIPPGVPHPLGDHYDPPNHFCDVLILSPRDHQMQCWLTQHRNGKLHAPAPSNLYTPAPALADYLERLGKELASNEPNAKPLCRHLLAALWLTLERELKQGRILELPFGEEPADRPEDNDVIARAQSYIRAHLHEPLTIQNVARASHLSRSQFIALFREQTGQTFVEYVTELRLAQACRLLRETDWTIPYICAFTGFGAPSYFHRLFRREIKMTPIQYRRHHAQKAATKENRKVRVSRDPSV